MKVYLVSQGRLSLTNLSAVIDIVAGYHQKDNILWMFLHGFYHARIVRHENTGKIWLLKKSGMQSTYIY